MSKPIILVDMDGTIADFEKGRERLLKRLYPEMNVIPAENITRFYGAEEYIYPEDQKKAYEVTLQPGFFFNLPIIRDSYSALLEMYEAGYDVQICTSPMRAAPDCELEKRAWIQKHFPWISKVHVTKDKHLIYGDILIDDHEDPLEKSAPGLREAITSHLVNNVSWVHLLKDAPHNRKAQIPRLVDWRDWRDSIIEALCFARKS